MLQKVPAKPPPLRGAFARFLLKLRSPELRCSCRSLCDEHVVGRDGQAIQRTTDAGVPERREFVQRAKEAAYRGTVPIAQGAWSGPRLMASTSGSWSIGGRERVEPQVLEQRVTRELWCGPLKFREGGRQFRAGFPCASWVRAEQTLAAMRRPGRHDLSLFF